MSNRWLSLLLFLTVPTLLLHTLNKVKNIISMRRPGFSFLGEQRWQQSTRSQSIQSISCLYHQSINPIRRAQFLQAIQLVSLKLIELIDGIDILVQNKLELPTILSEVVEIRIEAVLYRIFGVANR